MKQIWLVGALAFAVVACDPNTKPTDTIRNSTGSAVTDENGEETGERTGGYTISSVQVRTAVPDGETGGEFGANLLSGDLAVGADASISGLDCGIYDVMLTDSNGATCEISETSGLGPAYLCFSHSIWVLQQGVVSACEDFMEIGSGT